MIYKRTLSLVTYKNLLKCSLYSRYWIIRYILSSLILL